MLPARGLVLEIASGGGQHIVHFAKALPALTWQPNDPDPDARASIAEWVAAEKLDNVRPPTGFDARDATWPVSACDAILCINMIHIAPWTAADGLFAGANCLLPAGGVLYLYGPYRLHGRHTAPSNEAFDASLRAQDPQWGVRDLDDVEALAARHGFDLSETVAMPANNLSVVFRLVPRPRSRRILAGHGFGIEARMFRALMLALMLAGCCAAAAQPAGHRGEALRQVPGKAVIYLFRADPDFSREVATVMLDDHMMGSTYPGTYFRWVVEPGRHQIRGYAGDNGSIVLDVAPDRMYFVQQSVTRMFTGFAQSWFRPIPEPYGRAGVMRGELVGGR